MHEIIFGDLPPEGATIAIDTETTGLDFTSDIIGYSVGWVHEGKTASCFVLNTSRPNMQMDLFSPDGNAVDGGELIKDLFLKNPIVMHNAPFDYRVLYHAYGVEPPVTTHDTMHIGKMLDWQDRLTLEWLFSKYVGKVSEQVHLMKSKRSSMAKVPISQIVEYGKMDAEMTLALYMKMRPLAKTQLNYDLYRQDLEFTRLVFTLIKRGIFLDRDFLKQKTIDAVANMTRLNAYFSAKGLANPMSNFMVREFLLKVVKLDIKETTAKGGVSVSEKALESYRNVEEVQKIIEYRQNQKSIGSWSDEYLRLSETDGKIHAILSPFGTRSFRMSAQNPNVQGIPMEERGERAYGDFMGIFKAENPVEEFWAMDLKQAEARLACMLAGENNLAEVFTSGQDPYTAMSIRTWGTPDRRNDAKRATLSSIYEVGVNSFSIKYGVSVGEAEQILDTFRSTFPNIKKRSRFLENKADSVGYVELFTGRKRYFNPIDQHYEAFNQEVQGSLAEVMDRVMLQVEQAFPGRMVLQIHDSIVMNLPKNEEERNEIALKIQEIVDGVIPYDTHNGLEIRLPFPIEPKKFQ
jgi:DNA polymerase-1